MTLTASPCSAVRNFILPRPMPCSPVQVPSIASARMTRRSFRRSASASSFGSSRLIRKPRWKLPSPTWPTSGAIRKLSFRSFLVSMMHSVSLEIGTQTSVAQISQPGRSALLAYVTSWRAVHSAVRSSVLVAHLNSPPPCSAAIDCTISACSLTPASVPWNSTNSVSLTG